MRRITRHTLAIYFYLLQGKTLSIPYVANRIPKEELDSWCDKLERIVNRALIDTKNTKRQSEDLFSRKESNGVYELSLLEQQGDILKDYLLKYCEDLVNDNLETTEHNTHQWDYVRQAFIEKLKNSHYNLKCFHAKSIEDIYPLAPELIWLHGRSGYELHIRINTGLEYTSRYETLDDYLKEIFSFKCSADLSGMVKTKPHAEQIQLIRTDFTPQQQKMYDFLEDSAKLGVFGIERTELERFISSSAGDNALHEAIRKLNKQYQEIYNTDVKLLKYVEENSYALENVWNYRTRD